MKLRYRFICFVLIVLLNIALVRILGNVSPTFVSMILFFQLIFYAFFYYIYLDFDVKNDKKATKYSNEDKKKT